MNCMQLASYAALMKTKKSETDDNNINYQSAAAIICQFMHWLQARFQQKGGVHCNRVNVEETLEREKMRHAEIDQSLTQHPAMARLINFYMWGGVCDVINKNLYVVFTVRLIAGCGNDWSISASFF